MRLRFFAALAGASAVFAVFVACSSSDPHPEAGTTDREGGITSDASYKPKDSGADGAADDGGEAGAATGCSNGFKDNNETDTDCGGNVCGKCVDGKTCIKDTDCAGNACIQGDGGGFVCKTATCTDGVKNGDESDTDCGGTVCPKCNIGRACAVATDCTSKSCTGSQCGCPSGMGIVARTTGTSYCVDSAEITKGQYAKFVSATVPVNTQAAVCSGNTTFVPRGGWPALATPDTQGLSFSYAIPVHYVDWCDAYAYCKWSGKQLCGQINGGPVQPTAFADATQNAWYNACSSQGTKAYPYGTTFAPDQCNDRGGQGDAGSNGNGFGYGGINQDDGTYTVVTSDGTGNISGYTHIGCGSANLYQMSGNVAEWEDSCDTTNGATDQCRLRGGSYAAAGDGTKVRCDTDRKLDRVPAAPGGGTDPLADVGFRCCVY